MTFYENDEKYVLNGVSTYFRLLSLNFKIIHTYSKSFCRASDIHSLIGIRLLLQISNLNSKTTLTKREMTKFILFLNGLSWFFQWHTILVMCSVWPKISIFQQWWIHSIEWAQFFILFLCDEAFSLLPNEIFVCQR